MRAIIYAYIVLTLIGRSAFVQAQDMLAGLQPYVPKQKVAGIIRIRGNNYADRLVTLWQKGFRNFHPSVHFESSLQGSEAGIAALYSGAADLSFLGREIYSMETAAFVERLGYAPLGVETTTGSYDKPHLTFALMVFVHTSNPLSRISVSQLQRIFRCAGHGGGTPIRTWGQLGLNGAWRDRPIHIYNYGADSGFARFLQAEIFKNSLTWNPEIMEYYNITTPAGQEVDSGELILDALAADLSGIAFSNVNYGNANVTSLAVASADEGPYFEPSKKNVWKRAYPITRFTTAFLNRRPGERVDPRLEEFLRYIFSRDGQEIVNREGSYLPLTSTLVRDQLRKLE